MAVRRFLFGSLGAVALLLLVSFAQAGELTIETSSWRTGSGGEFKVSDFDDGVLTPASAVTDQDSGDFNTFCVEKSEYIKLGSKYDYSIGTAADGGGGGAVNGFDALGEDTAKLFYTFWTDGWEVGDGYGYDMDYCYTSSGRGADMADLQEAIWFLEDELDIAYDDLSDAVKDLVDYAGDVSWSDLGQGGWTGIGLVRVLNVYDTSNGAKRQSQLLVVPLPAGALMGLAGLGLVVALRRRRLRR